MQVTNEKVISHMREVFAFWRRGELKTSECMRDIEFVVGGWLVLNSGVDGFAASSLSLQETAEQSEELQAAMREFVFESRGTPVAKGGLLQLVLKTLLELLLANRQK